FVVSLLPRPLRAPLVPYTTLFRSTSLFAIVVFLVLGYTATYAVIWSMILGVLVSFLRRDTALWPKKLLDALEVGARQALSVVARSEEHTSELQSRENLVCRLLLEK